MKAIKSMTINAVRIKRGLPINWSMNSMFYSPILGYANVLYLEISFG
jgi:hypothetical protein